MNNAFSSACEHMLFCMFPADGIVVHPNSFFRRDRRFLYQAINGTGSKLVESRYR